MDKYLQARLVTDESVSARMRPTSPDGSLIASSKGWVGSMDEHEMWWSLRRILYRNTLSYAETEIIRDWLQGFPKVIRVMQSKTWDPQSKSIVDAFEQWYARWWESGVFKQL